MPHLQSLSESAPGDKSTPRRNRLQKPQKKQDITDSRYVTKSHGQRDTHTRPNPSTPKDKPAKVSWKPRKELPDDPPSFYQFIKNWAVYKRDPFKRDRAGGLNQYFEKRTGLREPDARTILRKRSYFRPSSCKPLWWRARGRLEVPALHNSGMSFSPPVADQDRHNMSSGARMALSQNISAKPADTLGFGGLSSGAGPRAGSLRSGTPAAVMKRLSTSPGPLTRLENILNDLPASQSARKRPPRPWSIHSLVASLEDVSAASAPKASLLSEPSTMAPGPQYEFSYPIKWPFCGIKSRPGSTDSRSTRSSIRTPSICSEIST